MVVVRRIFAVDPGERYCGFADVAVCMPGETRPPLSPEFPACSGDGRVRVLRCLTFEPPAELFAYLETNLRNANVLVIERFQLYPWLAREQGFSEFGTAEVVGVCQYLADKLSLRVVRQDAKKNLREGRQRALAWGFPMVDRVLGSGKFKYRGPDFSLPGKPHRRDAAAHALQYIGASGLYGP